MRPIGNKMIKELELKQIKYKSRKIFRFVKIATCLHVLLAQCFKIYCRKNIIFITVSLDERRFQIQ